jgi:hypothetical protein
VKILMAGAAFLALSSSWALADTCQETATSKKLAGAALNSFMGKCERDATADCQKQSAEKKLSGAAKTSFEKKCVKDAVGK